MFRSVARYSFSPNSLRREIRKDDFWKYKIKKEEVESLSVKVSDALARRAFTVNSLSMVAEEDGKNLFLLHGIEDNLLVRRTNTILNQFVNHPEYDRNEEIKQLSVLISTEPNAKILRTDISGFFESIDFLSVLGALGNNGYNNLPSIRALKSMRDFALSMGHEGLPRGLSVSSTLANYYMREFDCKARAIDTCFYYSRYVDDIMVILTSQSIDIESKIQDLLPPGLNLNRDKTQTSTIGDPGSIEYLGYSISLKDGKAISVAQKKINKTKTRIALSFLAFNRDRNFLLLLDRLKFLTCNTKMKKSGREKSVIVGFRYSYQLCDTTLVLKQMKELDFFYHKLLFSKTYKPSQKLRSALTDAQIAQLARLSFHNGHCKNIKTGLDRNEIARVKQAWKYA